ncbi:hypothetical protein LSAT2_012833, partial [Lamellibrachia satsuma]
ETPGTCCNNSKVKLQAMAEPADPLNILMQGATPESKHFLGTLRKYNSCFQMSTFGASREVHLPGFMPTFNVQGQVYHCSG